jgi:hypothetical protein
MYLSEFLEAFYMSRNQAAYTNVILAFRYRNLKYTESDVIRAIRLAPHKIILNMIYYDTYYNHIISRNILLVYHNRLNQESTKSARTLARTLVESHPNFHSKMNIKYIVN